MVPVDTAALFTDFKRCVTRPGGRGVGISWPVDVATATYVGIPVHRGLVGRGAAEDAWVRWRRLKQLHSAIKSLLPHEQNTVP